MEFKIRLPGIESVYIVMMMLRGVYRGSMGGGEKGRQVKDTQKSGIVDNNSLLKFNSENGFINCCLTIVKAYFRLETNGACLVVQVLCY